jgi:hypothetical protein
MKRRRRKAPSEKKRQQIRAFQELRVTRSKHTPKDTTAGVVKARHPKMIPPQDAIKSELARVRNLRCSPAKKRRLIARFLNLEKTLFQPKEFYKVRRGNVTLFTNIYTGQIYGKSERPSDIQLRYVNTRNVDYCADHYAIDIKISKFQCLLHYLTRVALDNSSIKLLRRLVVCFGGLHGRNEFKPLVTKLISRARGTEKKEDRFETQAWRKPYPACTGGRLPNLHVKMKRGVVSSPRYGDIPVLLAKERIR